MYLCVLYVSQNKQPLFPQTTLTDWFSYHRFNPLQPSGHYMYHQFNIQQFYVLPTHCVYVFCMYLRTNSHHFPIHIYIHPVFTTDTFQFTFNFTHEFNNLSLHVLFAPSCFHHVSTEVTCYNIRWFKELSSLKRRTLKVTKKQICRKCQEVANAWFYTDTINRQYYITWVMDDWTCVQHW